MNFDSKKLVDLLIIGCGNRGEVYASYCLKHPERARVLGLAEQRSYTRARFAEIHKASVNPKFVFNDWRQIDAKLANSVVIALPDKEHKNATIHFLNLGYNVLLEKPMATLLDDCRQIREKGRQNAAQINAVCHVLRYFAPCLKLKEIIDSGLIGHIVNINHTEPIGYAHFAHSFVRGNWHNESESTFSLLAKCCHDIDLIVHWMKGKKCVNVSSFGSLFYFREQNAPKNSSNFCLTCSEEADCAYSAKKIYFNSGISATNWPCSVVLQSEISNVLDVQNERDIEDLCSKLTESNKTELLRQCLSSAKTKYGRCVFKIEENNVCDNQVVNLEFEDGTTATLTMIAFSKDQCVRKTKIYGTLGELEWDDSKYANKISYFNFSTKKLELIDCEAIDLRAENLHANTNVKLSGHGGSDYYLMHAFVEACLNNDKSLVLTDFEDSFQSHLIVFAAEHARKTRTIVNIEQFCRANGINF